MLTFTSGFNPNPNSRSYKNKGSFSKAVARFWAVNKFVAHLLHDGQSRFNLFILWTMRTALESSPDRRDAMDNPEVFVPAAAACISIAGQEIRSCNADYPPGERTGRPGSGGPLWEGKHGFCEERWRLWKERFLSVSGESGISEEVGRAARDAHDEMERIDMTV